MPRFRCSLRTISRVRPRLRFSTSYTRLGWPIEGNDYRLIAAVAYRFQAVYIKFIGTHAQYDRIDAATVEDP